MGRLFSCIFASRPLMNFASSEAGDEQLLAIVNVRNGRVYP
jgi:hypothetical protein